MDEFSDLLDQAVSIKIVERIRPTRYRFRHALVRETIYDALPTAVRAKTHQAIAEALELLGCIDRDSTVSMLAHHSLMSLPYGASEKALDYAIRAGIEARRRLAYDEAVMQYEHALELAGSRISAASHCELLLSLGEAQARSGRWLDSRHTFERAASEARLIPSAEHFGRAAIGFKGMLGGTIPVDDAAIALLREAMARLGSDDGALHVRVLSALTYALYFGRAEGEMEEHSHRAVEMAGRLGDRGLQCTALEARLSSLFRPSHIGELLATANELISIAIPAGDREMAFRGQLFRYICFLELSDPIGSTLELERASKLADELRDPRCLWQVALAHASQATASGDLPQGLRLADLARSIGERVHDSSPTHYLLLQRFQLERLRGNLQGWDEMATTAIAQYPSVIGYRAAQALIYAVTGDIRQARKMLSLLAAAQFRDIPCDCLFLWTMGMLAEACAACEEHEWCARLYNIMLPYRDHSIVVSWGVAFDGAVAHFLGVLAEACGEFQKGESHFESALTMNNRMGADPLVARTQQSYAKLLLRVDEPAQREQARQHLTQAIKTMERCGQLSLIGNAQELLARAEENVRCRAIPNQPVRERLPDGNGFARDWAVEEDLSGEDFVFRREGDFWTIVFEGRVLRVRNTRGLAFLSTLIRSPGVDVHVLDLVGAIEGTQIDEGDRRAGRRKGRVGTGLMLGDAGPLIDTRARDEYRRRLADLRSELAEAESFNDVGRVAALREEAEQVQGELQRAYGQGGRHVVAASASERARVSVRNNISNTLKMLTRSSQPLWRHLRSAVRTGTFCSYHPERSLPWRF